RKTDDRRLEDLRPLRQCDGRTRRITHCSERPRDGSRRPERCRKVQSSFSNVRHGALNRFCGHGRRRPQRDPSGEATTGRARLYPARASALPPSDRAGEPRDRRPPPRPPQRRARLGVRSVPDPPDPRTEPGRRPVRRRATDAGPGTSIAGGAERTSSRRDDDGPVAQARGRVARPCSGSGRFRRHRRRGRARATPGGPYRRPRVRDDPWRSERAPSRRNEPRVRLPLGDGHSGGRAVNAPDPASACKEPDGVARLPDECADVSASEMVRHGAGTRGDEPAYIAPEGATTWSEYDRAADRVYAALVPADGSAAPPAAALYLPDTAEFHVALVGAYRAGVRVAALGSRSGPTEVAHVMSTAGARVLVTASQVRGTEVDDLLSDLAERDVPVEKVVLVEGTEVTSNGSRVSAVSVDTERAFSVDEISMLNSTSGTTGRPNLVTQTQRRWVAFAALACRNGELSTVETVAAFVPAPFGFGLWTSHFLPALLGRPALVMERFTASMAIAMMRDHHATVLACVSTQFRMMLHSEQPQLAELTTLRVMFTGGEAVPYSEAKRFEEVTGARSLQFYGSNETGAASATSLH